MHELIERLTKRVEALEKDYGITKCEEGKHVVQVVIKESTISDIFFTCTVCGKLWTAASSSLLDLVYARRVEIDEVAWDKAQENLGG